MNPRKMRLYAAGLIAFLLGMPLTEQAFAQSADIVGAAINLAGAVIDSAGRS
jgi:hypothetical protein